MADGMQEWKRRRQLHAKYRGQCARCLIHPAAGIHEIVPRSAGGELIEENQVPLCQSCHELVQADWRAYVDELHAAQRRARELFGTDIQVHKETV